MNRRFFLNFAGKAVVAAAATAIGNEAAAEPPANPKLIKLNESFLALPPEQQDLLLQFCSNVARAHLGRQRGGTA